jgi:hypothetical protein
MNTKIVLTTLKTHKSAALITLLTLLLVLGGYYSFHTIASLKSANELSQQTIHQNAAAYNAQLIQKADSIQNLAAVNQNLNSNYNRDKTKWNITEQHLQAQIDSFHTHGSATSTVEGDSIRVTFSGKQGIFNYSGYTLGYLSPLVKPSYGLNGWYDSFNIYDTLSYDVKSSLFKSSVRTDAPGLKFTAYPIIDSSVYSAMLPKVKTASEGSNIFPSFGLMLKANLGLSMSQAAPVNGKFNSVSLDASAMAYYKYFNLTYYPFSQYVSLGVFYNFDAGRALNKIF